MAIKLPTKRDIQRLLPRQRDFLRMVTGRRIREPIPASKKKKALEKAKGKCQWPGCNKTNNYVKLQFHHINLKNDDNNLLNIQVLCPTHHSVIHSKIKRKIEKDVLGREIKSRLIKVKPRKKTKRRKVGIFGVSKITSPSFKWGI